MIGDAVDLAAVRERWSAGNQQMAVIFKHELEAILAIAEAAIAFCDAPDLRIETDLTGPNGNGMECLRKLEIAREAFIPAPEAQE